LRKENTHFGDKENRKEIFFCLNENCMSYNIQNRASNIEISSQLTGDNIIDTPQKVNIDALKSKIRKQEKKENFKNKAILVSLFIGLGTVGYFISS
tara:strand:- start:139 stop:426 length:288 start_codon:yes stop_codon:yes gene_type:complete